MTSGVHRTHAALRPDELDDFLERGWYRIGSVLIASRYYLHDKELYSTVWTRLPLDGWRPRKGQRKRLARLRRRFDVQVVPFAWTPEHEALYDRYLEVAPGERSETLRDFLGGDEGQVLFETWAVEIRDDEKLVAFSLFDVGRTALQSLTGVYDPDYGQHGLGGMTLLLEAEHGLKHGYDWHYSGYVVPGADFMDYKWQLSEDMEFLHPEHGDWCHRQSFSVLETPDQRLKRRLRQVATALSRRQVAVGWRVKDLFSAPHLHEPLSQCLAEPLVLVLPRTQKGQPLIVWDDVNGELRVLLGLPVEVQRTFNSDPSTSRMDRTWIVQEAQRLLR
jgi:arginyl-tRNA--protein-N-Asp/Glu arginylyltransferase